MKYLLPFLGFSIAAPLQLIKNHELPVSYNWKENWVQNIEIHESCNVTSVNQLKVAFEELNILVDHAKDHTLRYGSESPFFSLYFGNNSQNDILGLFENTVRGDKSGFLIRCDDLDNKCKNEGWAGYWRGKEHPDETNICDLSFQTREFLPQLCSNGYTVSKSKNNLQWSSDLLHRVFHTSIGKGVDHYADKYDDCLDLAHTPNATMNSASLIYYALDVYAFDIAVPGVGCNGDERVQKLLEQWVDDLETQNMMDLPISATNSSPIETTSTEPSSTESTSVETTKISTTKSTQASPTSKTSESATTPTSHSSCHTHADGEVHC